MLEVISRIYNSGERKRGKRGKRGEMRAGRKRLKKAGAIIMATKTRQTYS